MNLEALTPGQRQVFDLLVKGLSNKAIACEIERSEGSVKAYVTAIMKALDCKARSEVIAKYYQHMLAALKPPKEAV